ncbi:MAG: ferrous iron transporter B, partial [Rhodocyclaceae bacterium]|nr:ferrous iron transporter B [Rhodocyclaceae bacterium]
MNAHYRIALAGNPNCGKTTLFNALTGARRHVGNWPGVTVEKKSGEYRHDGKTIEVIDLPGTYSLDVHQVSLDERVAHDFIAGGTADLIVNIVDAANLERNLYLTTQLAAMRAPMLVVLNMIDVAEAKGQPVDAQALAARLGCPVVPVVAAKGTGVDALKTALNEAAARKTLPTLAQLDDAHGDDVAAATTRYGLASQLAGASVQAAGVNVHPLTERIDNVALNRWLGVPIYLLLMYLMFMFTIQIGGAFIDFFDQFAGAIFVDGFAVLLGGI